MTKNCSRYLVARLAAIIGILLKMSMRKDEPTRMLLRLCSIFLLTKRKKVKQYFISFTTIHNIKVKKTHKKMIKIEPSTCPSVANIWRMFYPLFFLNYYFPQKVPPCKSFSYYHSQWRCVRPGMIFLTSRSEKDLFWLWNY